MQNIINKLQNNCDLKVEITKHGFAIIYVPTNEYIGFYRKGVYCPVIIHQVEYQLTLSPIFKQMGFKVAKIIRRISK